MSHWIYLEKDKPNDSRRLPRDGERVAIYKNGKYYACKYDNWSDSLETVNDFYLDGEVFGQSIRIASRWDPPEKWMSLEN